MPLMDGAAHVGEAVESVLAQSVGDVELIVVDSHSTDGGPQIVRRLAPGATVLDDDRRGPSAARNLGVEASNGAYLTFLDADDVLADGSFGVRLARLDEEPSIDAVFGRVEEFVSGDVSPAARRLLRRPYGPTAARLGGTMLIRRKAFQRVGAFDPRGEFIEWLARAVDAGLRLASIEPVVLHRRLHDANFGLGPRAAPERLIGALRSVLSRRSNEGRTDR
jgi:glycosyltransferase involved in cell wall biosynthesis